VLVALITALLLLLSGYNGYAGLEPRRRRSPPRSTFFEPLEPVLLEPGDSARAARPRWLIASFCSSESCAIVNPSGPPRPAGTPGRSRTRPHREAPPPSAPYNGPSNTRASSPGACRVDIRERAHVRAARCPPAPRAAASPGSARRWRARPHTAPSAHPALRRAPPPRSPNRRRCSPGPSPAPRREPCRARSPQ
jgi:hypothetical protein